MALDRRISPFYVLVLYFIADTTKPKTLGTKVLSVSRLTGEEI